MVMKRNGNVRGKVRVNFLALFLWKPHIFMWGSLALLRIVRANVRLNIAIPSLFLVPDNRRASDFKMFSWILVSRFYLTV